MRRPASLIAAALLSSAMAMTACARTPEPAPVKPATSATARTVLPLVVVHKSATCSCCAAWVDHLRDAKFRVEIRNEDHLDAIKSRVGVPPGKSSCHTAEVGGYFVEGHVPAADIKRLLAEKPHARGLVLPGMPLGSPGMEVPGGRTQPYTVELVGADGSTTTFAEHGR
jgi:hypothetical protein